MLASDPPRDVAAAIRASWSVETCDDVDVPDWSPDNPARGQCGASALVLQDLVGGDVLLSEVLHPDGSRQGWHYANRLPDGTVVDLTAEQFSATEVLQEPVVVERPAGPPGRCAAQYSLLGARVQAHLEQRFVGLVLRNDVNRAVLERGHLLGVPDWWLTAGAVFQTVWNVLDGRDPGTGIDDYDLFSFDDTDLSWEAEDAVIRRAAQVFAGTGVRVEVRNEARVHLWYAQRFGVPAAPFRSTRDAVDHFASTTCCYALTRSPDGAVEVYAPHGFVDLFAQRLRPNPVLAPREVYEAKAARWAREWPGLRVDPWPGEP